ncbi:DUF3604 domain-containing protein [Palleronia sp. KMU-117]|uniref:DUF3604 domain-containing protein n=1 Tax=Palleronia sp. KMU-117 TaxID=3434108 RepID=UPI003D761E59
MRRSFALVVVFAMSAVALPTVAQEHSTLTPEVVISDGLPAAFPPAPYSPNAGADYPDEVFFGDMHVHTMLSADAGGAGATLLPDDAYRFAMGEEVVSTTGQRVQLSRPLDFFMLTEHSDGMGVILDILTGAPNILAEPIGAALHEAFNRGGTDAQEAVWEMIGLFSRGELPEALLYEPGNPAFDRVWNEIIDAAEQFYVPGQFSTFVAFEWTPFVNGNNLHRNVIFRDGADKVSQIAPFTTTPPVGSPNPRDLWAWMQTYEDDTGGQVLAVPHNGNLSNGIMFPLVDTFADNAPLDADYARLRQAWEPLYEVTQVKGDGEAHPLLSPDDAFADYETWDFGNLDMSEAKTPEMLPGEYARSGLQRGLLLERELGVNPFKFGLVGATDTHTGLATFDESNFFGKFVSYEPNPGRATHLSQANPDLGLERLGWTDAASGITAVWATENTREAIFDAMARREVYATTGPRIKVRLFGGWDYPADAAVSPDMVGTGYRGGVPMGGDLRPRPATASAPRFIASALRDPDGANLDRLQIIKGWVDAEGATREQVYDVAWSDGRVPDAQGALPPVGSTVDLSGPTWTNTIGAVELAVVWQDPDFDPALPAFYYARVIEIPTPRWTAYDAVAFDLDLPEDIPLITQERAYTSPIWYTPSK